MLVHMASNFPVRTTTSVWLRPVLFKVIMEGTHLFARSRPAMVPRGEQLFLNVQLQRYEQGMGCSARLNVAGNSKLGNQSGENPTVYSYIVGLLPQLLTGPHSIKVCIDSIDRW